MRNGDRIRRTGDTDLANFIVDNLQPFKKCSMCAIGLDKNNRCKKPEIDCAVGVFEWLNREEK